MEDLLEALEAKLQGLTQGRLMLWDGQGAPIGSTKSALWDNQAEPRAPVPPKLPGCHEIRLQEETVAYLRLTGEDEHAADIVAKMAEAMAELLLKQELLDQKCLSEQLFIREWIFSHAATEDESFYFRGKMLGIDITRSYALLLMNIQHYGASFGEERQRKLLQQTVASELCDVPLGKVVFLEEYLLVLMDPGSPEGVRRKVRQLKSRLESVFFITLYGGICTSGATMSECFYRARLACETAEKKRLSEFVFYDDLGLSFVLQSIPGQIQADFSNKVFAGLREKDLKEWLSTLQAFFDCNGSVTQAAEALYIHKNTLQYRINKIHEETGYNPRNTKEAFVLYLALLLKGDV